MRLPDFVQRIMTAIVVVIAASFVSAILISYAPGTGVDERELDFHLSGNQIRWLQSQYASERSLWANCKQIVVGAKDGSFGVSAAFNQPVGDLVKRHAGKTFALLLSGMLVGWCAAAMAAAAGHRWRVLGRMIGRLSSAYLVVPAGALACAVGLTNPYTPLLCVALAVFARTAPHLSLTIEQAYEEEYVRFAQANGMSRAHVLGECVLPAIVRRVHYLMGISVNVALGAAFIAEIVCDRPGLGSFAIQCAMARDPQPVIVTTALVCMVTVLANPRGQRQLETGLAA